MIYPAVVCGGDGCGCDVHAGNGFAAGQYSVPGLPGAKLPLLTTVLLTVSGLIIKFWWVFIILAVIAFIYTSRWARTVAGKKVVDGLKMHTKPFGPLFEGLHGALLSNR